MSGSQIQTVGGISSAAAAVPAGAAAPLPIDPATGAVRTTATGGGPAAAVVGTKTTDISHATQTDALDTRSHGYARGVEWAPPAAAPTVGTLMALAAPADPYNWTYSYDRYNNTTDPRPLQVSAIAQGFNQALGFVSVGQSLATWCVPVTPSTAALYSETAGSSRGLQVESVLVGTDGTSLYRARLNATSKALNVGGTHTADASHTAPTDALEELAHNYVRDPVSGSWYAAPVSDDAFPYYWTLQRVPISASMISGWAGGGLASTPLALALPATWGADLYNGYSIALKVSATMVASTGTGLRPVGLDTDSQGAITSPRTVDLDGDPQPLRSDTATNLFTQAALPELDDTENAPTTYLVPLSGAGSSGAPCWLLGLVVSVTFTA